VLSRSEEPLTLEETLSAVALRLRHHLPFDAVAVFAANNDVLTARYALGENVRHLSSLRVPMGEGLIGWVAETGNCIINGNPTVEPGLEKSRASMALRSALAVPLLKSAETIGVLAVYALQADSFTSEHLAVLQTTGSQLSVMIGERLQTESAQRPSRSADWRHHTGHARRRSAENSTEAFAVSAK
jgi:GAF domain-containing protein